MNYFNAIHSDSLIHNTIYFIYFIYNFIFWNFSSVYFEKGEFMNFLESDSDPYNEQSKRIERFPEDENRLIYSVFEQIQIGIAIVDAEGMCLKVNLHLCEILDHSESELLGPGFKRIIFIKGSVLNSGYF